MNEIQCDVGLDRGVRCIVITSSGGDLGRNGIRWISQPKPDEIQEAGTINIERYRLYIHHLSNLYIALRRSKIRTSAVANRPCVSTNVNLVSRCGLIDASTSAHVFVTYAKTVIYVQLVVIPGLLPR